jgi:hypothetical protein
VQCIGCWGGGGDSSGIGEGEGESSGDGSHVCHCGDIDCGGSRDSKDDGKSNGGDGNSDGGSGVDGNSDACFRPVEGGGLLPNLLFTWSMEGGRGVLIFD